MKKMYEIPTSELIYVATCDIITNSPGEEDTEEDVNWGPNASVGG